MSNKLTKYTAINVVKKVEDTPITSKEIQLILGYTEKYDRAVAKVYCLLFVPIFLLVSVLLHFVDHNKIPQGITDFLGFVFVSLMCSILVTTLLTFVLYPIAKRWLLEKHTPINVRLEGALQLTTDNLSNGSFRDLKNLFSEMTNYEKLREMKEENEEIARYIQNVAEQQRVITDAEFDMLRAYYNGSDAREIKKELGFDFKAEVTAA